MFLLPYLSHPVLRSGAFLFLSHTKKVPVCLSPKDHRLSLEYKTYIFTRFLRSLALVTRLAYSAVSNNRN